MCFAILRASPPFGNCSISREDNLLYIGNVIATEDSLCSPLLMVNLMVSSFTPFFSFQQMETSCP